MIAIPLAILAAIAVAGAAAAQEVIVLEPTQPGERSRMDDPKARADGDWARGVIERAAEEARTGKKVRAQSCEPREDKKPHGVVWAGIGTEGWREVGGVVTYPLGECGDITLGASMTQDGGNRPPPRGRRR